jgi:hypothetical protein
VAIYVRGGGGPGLGRRLESLLSVLKCRVVLARLWYWDSFSETDRTGGRVCWDVTQARSVRGSRRFGGLLDPEDEVAIIVRNVGNHSANI